MGAASETVILASAQLSVARKYGFLSWARLKSEVERREALDTRDVIRLRKLLAEHPEPAVEPMLHGVTTREEPARLAMSRCCASTRRGASGATCPAPAPSPEPLLEAGAPVDGDLRGPETPLMTAASYGDAEVAQVLVDAGANLAAATAADSGGVPRGTALRHAAVFGMLDVVDVLPAAGATDLLQAAAAGDITAALEAEPSLCDRVAALRVAAERGRLEVIDQLLEAATPVDGVDVDGSTALHEAAFSGRADSVGHG